MSVTICQTPEQFTPAYNEQVFLTSGVVSGKNNYKYVFNIYDSTGVNKLVPTIKIPPRPSDNWAVFDAGRIIENYLSSDIAIVGSDNFKSNTNSTYGYVVKFGEEYDLSTTGVTTYPDQVTSSGVVYAFNAAYSFEGFADYNYQTRLCSAGDATTQLTRFLSTNPNTTTGTVDGSFTYTDLKTVRINRDENAWIYMMRSNTRSYSWAIVVTYGSNGSQQKSLRVTNPYFNQNGYPHLRFPTGTRNINTIPTGSITLLYGSYPIIDSSTAFYDVYMFDNSLFTQHSEVVRYVIQDTPSSSIKLPYQDCTKYDSYRLHFLNKFGGFDSITFNKVSHVTEDIERKTYKKLYGSTTGRWSYNPYDRGNTNYNTSIKDKLTLSSDWLTEEEYAWLEELISSPEVYWDNNNELWAVNITDNNYEKKKTVNDKTLSLTINIEITQKRFTQRG